MYDTPDKVLQLRSVSPMSTLCDNSAVNDMAVVSGDAMSEDIAQFDGCSVALEELLARVVREPHCTNEIWKEALSWVAEQGFDGEPCWLGVDPREPDLEVWAIARWKEEL